MRRAAGGELNQQQRQALGWLRKYAATVAHETFRLGLSKVLPALKLPDEDVADRLLSGVLAAYMRQVVAWRVSEVRQRRIWHSAQALVEEQTQESLEVTPTDW